MILLKQKHHYGKNIEFTYKMYMISRYKYYEKVYIYYSDDKDWSQD